MPGTISFINKEGSLGWEKYQSPSDRTRIINEFLELNPSDEVLYISILPQTNIKHIDNNGRNIRQGLRRAEDKLLK